MSYQRLKNLYEQQYKQPFHFDTTAEYKAIRPLPTDHVTGIYMIRYRIYQDSGRNNVTGWEVLIEGFESYKGNTIVIQMVSRGKLLSLFFTDEEYEIIIGEICFDTTMNDQGNLQ